MDFTPEENSTSLPINKSETPVRRSIRQIPKSNERNTSSLPLQQETYTQPSSPIRSYRPGSNKKPLFIAGGVVVLLLFGFLIMTAMGSGAVIHATPRVEELTVENETLSIGGPNSDATLRYEDVTYSKDATRELKATGKEHVEEKASGKIVIVNSYSDQSQVLVANTRFRTPDGKIFRIKEPITIPGMKGTNPGTLEVVVWADEPGDSYNIKPTSFVIPGFEDDKEGKFKKITASSKEAMIGGFSGEKKVVSEEEKETVLKELKKEIEQQLASATPKLPKEMYVIKSSEQEVVFTTLPEIEKGDNVVVGLRGTITTKAININDVARFYAKDTIDNYADEEVVFADVKSVNISLSEQQKEGDLIDIVVTIKTPLVYSINEKELIQKVKGLSLDELEIAQKEIISISDLTIELKPFWRMSIPTNESDISLIIDNKQ